MVQQAKRKAAHGKSRTARSGRATADRATADQDLVPSYSAQERQDCVLTASIDSFPASDPPGWIPSAASPHIDDTSNLKPAKSPRKKRRH